MTEPLITRVLRHYFPEWEAPKHGRYEWVKCLCPWHGDENPSASVSYVRNAFNCHACGVKGDAYSIIASREVLRYSEAIKFAEELFDRGDSELPPEPARKSGRRVFAEPGAVPVERRGIKVPARLRRRTFGVP